MSVYCANATCDKMAEYQVYHLIGKTKYDTLRPYISACKDHVDWAASCFEPEKEEG